MKIFHSLQKNYEGTLYGLLIPTMTEEEFEDYDVDNNGILTWLELKGLGYGYAYLF